MVTFISSFTSSLERDINPLYSGWFGAWYESNHIITSVYYKKFVPKLVFWQEKLPHGSNNSAGPTKPLFTNLTSDTKQKLRELKIRTKVVDGEWVLINLCRSMTKPTQWPVRPVTTQFSLGIRLFWSESTLCLQWVAKDPRYLYADSEYYDQTGQMPRLICVYAGCTGHFVDFVMLLLLSMFSSGGAWGGDTLLNTQPENLYPPPSPRNLTEYWELGRGLRYLS